MTISENSLLLTKTEMVFEISVYTPFSHMMRLIARRDLIEFSHTEALTLYINKIALMIE